MDPPYYFRYLCKSSVRFLKYIHNNYAFKFSLSKILYTKMFKFILCFKVYIYLQIADFGLSNVFKETSLLSTFCGSPLYASPEIVKGTPYIGPEVRLNQFYINRFRLGNGLNAFIFTYSCLTRRTELDKIFCYVTKGW